MSYQNQWKTISEDQAARFTKFKDRRCRVDKDVVRTDRREEFYSGEDNPNVDTLRNILLAYTFYNFDLGYCQGMSDLLSPLLFVMRNEADAFWCFVALMKRMERNFHRDQTGMHEQLTMLRQLIYRLDPKLHNYFYDRSVDQIMVVHSLTQPQKYSTVCPFSFAGTVSTISSVSDGF